jgi:hypothetical protein
MKLMLGFESISYSVSAPVRRRVKVRPTKDYGQGKTTGDVSKDLEERYKIVDTFYTMEEDYIIDLIEEQAALDLDEVMTMESPSEKGISFAETDKIEERFRQDLSRRKFDGAIYGVPTKAAQRESRQSFIKTGRYRSSFRAWMEE